MHCPQDNIKICRNGELAIKNGCSVYFNINKNQYHYGMGLAYWYMSQLAVKREFIYILKIFRLYYSNYIINCRRIAASSQTNFFLIQPILITSSFNFRKSLIFKDKIRKPKQFEAFRICNFINNIISYIFYTWN